VKVNESQPGQVLRLLSAQFPVLKGVRVTVLGLAFKPGTDDIRESPALPIVRELIEQGTVVTAYDPVVTSANGYLPLGSIVYARSLLEAVQEADAIILLTRWPEFKQLADVLRNRSTPPLIVDGRRMLDASQFARYEGIGRGRELPR
jgi:UDPglucose 6-dehydrogenase